MEFFSGSLNLRVTFGSEPDAENDLNLDAQDDHDADVHDDSDADSDVDSDAASDADTDAGSDAASSSRRPRISEALSLQIFANASQDRKRSLERLENHTPMAGAPTTQRGRQLWREYFRTFFTNTLELSSDVCPNGGHLYWFVDTMVHNMQTRIPGKQATSRNTIIVGLKYLEMEFTEEYKKFQITKHDTRRLDSLMKRFVMEGKLTKGKWEQKAFIGKSLSELTDNIGPAAASKSSRHP